MAHHEIIIAGFGGQGIMSAGNILAYAGMMDDKHVSWYPAYGPEKRGGAAACHVIISDDPIGSPILNSAQVLIAMSRPALDTFESIVTPYGIVIIDSSMTEKDAERNDIEVIKLPFTMMASEMGNQTYANIIMLGKLIAKTGIVSKENIEIALKKALPEKYHHLIPEEMKALAAGIEYC